LRFNADGGETFTSERRKNLSLSGILSGRGFFSPRIK
jgi:hypothetical protein